jgi:hypothetical protein
MRGCNGTTGGDATGYEGTGLKATWSAFPLAHTISNSGLLTLQLSTSLHLCERFGSNALVVCVAQVRCNSLRLNVSVVLLANELGQVR